MDLEQAASNIKNNSTDEDLNELLDQCDLQGNVASALKYFMAVRDYLQRTTQEK